MNSKENQKKERNLMIEAISKITIYVNNQNEAKTFWLEKMGFVISFEQQMGPEMTWLEVAPSRDSKTSFVLYDKEMMKKQNPDNPVTHPSVILTTKAIETIHTTLKTRDVKVTDLMVFPYGKMFTFYDQDNNPYLLRED